MLDTIARLIIVAIIVVITVWDVAVVSMGRPDTTISAVILKLSKEHPMIPFALGVVIGHLFWPNFRG
tara:strand:- start:90 stop:290 length:201 start_codon:yes stop_codon:yes gene_type:complete